MIDTTAKDWHRKAIGGRWDEIGSLQFEFMVKRGLKPDSVFLDLGCGSLRGGVHFIDYLDKGKYHATEKEVLLIRAAHEVEIPRYNLQSKEPKIYQIDNFNLSKIDKDVMFDFVLAQSVFTHILPEGIRRCLKLTGRRMKDGGEFYATFREGDTIDKGKPHRWRGKERGIAVYPFEMFKEISSNTGFEVEYIGDWGHPREQKMLLFRRKVV